LLTASLTALKPVPMVILKVQQDAKNLVVNVVNATALCRSNPKTKKSLTGIA